MLACGLLCAAGLGLSTPEPQDAQQRPSTQLASVDFARDVKPILDGRCIECHGPRKRKGDLRLDQRLSTLAVVAPGDSARSLLLERVLSTDSMERMPQAGPALEPQQIETLRRWIDAGADWPAELENAFVAPAHWSYAPIVRPQLPGDVALFPPSEALDALVAAQRDKHGLSASPPADPVTLLRRVSLDLTGLPPTLARVDAFLADPTETAYELVVDGLLASPQYAERMTQWWLDLARFADTNGYEKDARRSNWPWRDWVIDAFTANMPFDQFTLRQIAGDLLPSATLEDRIATGFCRNTLVNEEGGTDAEEFRSAAVVDRTNTVSTIWLASTLACAQCHDHKFDPFSQKEYFELYAYFDNTTDTGNVLEPLLRLPTSEQARQEAELAARTADLRRQLAQCPAPRSLVHAQLVPARYTPQAQLLEEELQQRDAELAALRGHVATTLVLEERAQRRQTHVHLKGSHLSPGDEVQPGLPAVLSAKDPHDPADRLAFARWLTSKDNPLTARVIANRLWARLFGRGLVASLDDFGTRGDAPSHPELLDWLACALVDSGWDVRAFQKTIVMSATYRQSSHVHSDLLERDPSNVWLARGPRLRLEIETLRDVALFAAGLLNPQLKGPSVMPYQPDGVWAPVYSNDQWSNATDAERYRRGLYVFWRRSSPYATFTLFDAPSRELSCTVRARTNTPLQALALLNDPAFVECAAALGKRALAEGGEQDAARAAHLFRLATAREPRAQELDVLLDLLAIEREQRGGAGGEIDSAEQAAWTTLANVVLNLDETVMRN